MKREPTNHAKAGKLIRGYMKAQGIVGTVRGEQYAGGATVRVHVEDLVPAQYQALKEFAKNFEYGTFNGMEDIYEYDNVQADLPQVTFVFVENAVTLELRQKIWDFARGYYAGMEAAPANVLEANQFFHAGFNRYGQELIYQLFDVAGYGDTAYWNFVNEVAVAA
jgi:hypothetical protein